ncbi:glycosyltransferase [Streptomyces sp. NPDC001674]|uniref:glycosyltransferase n=1 Tax=Streptomyces sp. NPDC001674 TaxID=3154394 RepID=UPI003317B818
MKVLLISDARVETGRGPVTRLAHVLPELSRRAEVSLVVLGEPDPFCAGAFAAAGVTAHPAPFALDGWRVRDLPGLLAVIEAAVRREQPDLVVLYREIWDLMHALPPVLARLGTPFLVMPHSVPFLDALPRPSRSFTRDLARRVLTERRGHALRYLLTHAHQAPLMRTLPRVVINETVEHYLDGYFPTAPSVRAVPGYAIDLPAIEGALAPGRVYDLAFMAKLTEGKGLFDALAALRRLRADRPGARMLVIGSFEQPRVEQRFHRTVERYGLRGAVDLTGWLTGPEKYRALSSAKVFCYPSRSADTFSLCLLEALACGLPAVCWDVPFARAVYGDTTAVRALPYGDTTALAAAAGELLDGVTLRQERAAAREFAARYCSWGVVAEAEVAAYQRFLAMVSTTPQNIVKG